MPEAWLQLELTRPWLLVALAALPLVFYYFRRSLVDFPYRQRVASLVLRSLIVVLLVLALADLTLLVPTSRKFVVFVVDASLSVGRASRAAALAYLRRAQEHAGSHKTAFVAFAERPGPIASDPPDSLDLDDGAEATNLAAAVEVAAAAIPPFYVPHLVVLSDGNQTEGDLLQAALGAGVPISTVPLAVRDDPEVQVSAVEVPAQVRQGEPFEVEVAIDSNRDGEGTIEIFRGPHRVESSRQTVEPGENRFRFRQTVEDERLVELTARIRGFDDTLVDNNTATGLVFATGKPRVLLIAGNPQATRELVWGLREQDIEADVRPGDGVPDSLSALQSYDAVILANVPATALTVRQMEVIRSYVQDLGGGLLMLGGDQSFGLGGYYKTVLEEVLPLRCDFEKEKEKPSLAMVLVIDKSGSMGGIKLELVKEAARGTVELLGPKDQIGVIAFDAGSYWVSPIESASRKHAIIDRIRTIEPSGGTNLYPAMEDAFEALDSAVARLKHAIVLTDGISAPGDFESIAARMASAQITVSTVAVGEGADRKLLETIAQIGNGRYYFCDNPQSIPQVFAKETITAGKAALQEQPFVPQVVRPSAVLNEVDLASAPFLLGYVKTEAKPTSEVILATESGDPLLVWWRYGLAVTVAFTSDASSRWAAEWLTWPEFGRFWAQVIRHAMRKSEAKGIFVHVERRGRTVEVSLDAVDPSGGFLNLAETELNVIDPGLGVRKLRMPQTAPGRYRVEFDAPRPGTYHLELSQRSDGGETFHQSRGLVVGYPDELRLRPTNHDLLREVALATGGSYSPDPEEPFASGPAAAARAVPLWPYLLIATALVFVGDVFLRRIDLALLRRTVVPAPASSG